MLRRETGPNHEWNQGEERSSETRFENDDNSTSGLSPSSSVGLSSL